jgi:hypothetical protein
MFKGFPLGTVRIYGTEEILSVISDGAIAEGVNVSDIILTENYIQLPPHIKFDLSFKSEYELNKKQWISFVDKTEGFYFIEFYQGVKYGQLNTEGWHNTEFYCDEERYDIWEKNIFDRYSFEAEYTVYLNSPERKKEKQLRQINKLEKILASQKQKVYA